jgi:predicted MPP superfamily phosphohydrolase
VRTGLGALRRLKAGTEILQPLTERSLTVQLQRPRLWRPRMILRLILPPAFLLVAGAVLWGFFVEANRLVLEEVPIRLPNLPAEFDGFRIAFLSDLELSPDGLRRREIRALETVEKLAPDAILVAGDLADGPHPGRRAEAAGRFLRGLRAPQGVWVVRGNRDLVHDSAYANSLIEVARRNGARILANQVDVLTRNGAKLYLAGVDFRGESPVFLSARDESGKGILRAGPSARTVYAYFRGDANIRWRDYELEGRFRSTSIDGGVGVGVYDGLPDGLNRHYRLHYYPGRAEFTLFGSRTDLGGPALQTEVRFEPGFWYRFRVRVHGESEGNYVEARVWPEDSPEPNSWQASGYDDHPDRPTGGTVSLWAFGTGYKDFDDLVVRSLGSARGTEILLAESFENSPVVALPPGWIDFGNTARKVEETLRDVPPEATLILLVHSPDVIEVAARAGADLVLAGHTHGGQIRLPLVGALHTGTELGRAYSAGLFEFPPARLYVGRGLGTSYLPLRLLCPPEVTLIRLER